MQELDPNRTTWHITFGTYAARLHGDERPTVDRRQNQPGEPFLTPNPARVAFERSMARFPPVEFDRDQQVFIESVLPSICERGRWNFRVCAAGPDHVHILCDVDPVIHGKQARAWMKRWLTDALDKRWVRPPKRPWWADGGSNKPVKDRAYLNNAFAYIARQRATAG